MRRLRKALKLGRLDFNVCFVDDLAIRRLNAAYRGKTRPTDVLAFPWDGSGGPWPRAGARSAARPGGKSELAHFIGDVLISARTAQRNARVEGHSTANEIRWLILHGLLHLVGYDHETDTGEMIALELSLRASLGLDVRKPAKGRPRFRVSPSPARG